MAQGDQRKTTPAKETSSEAGRRIAEAIREGRRDDVRGELASVLYALMDDVAAGFDAPENPPQIGPRKVFEEFDARPYRRDSARSAGAALERILSSLSPRRRGPLRNRRAAEWKAETRTKSEFLAEGLTLLAQFWRDYSRLKNRDMVTFDTYLGKRCERLRDHDQREREGTLRQLRTLSRSFNPAPLPDDSPEVKEEKAWWRETLSADPALRRTMEALNPALRRSAVAIAKRPTREIRRRLNLTTRTRPRIR